MFELSFIKKYLTPQRRQLSVSLIALLSVAVITLVVWLVVVFLSVTEGIEQTWLQKMTSLNAPVRLQPTQEYFNSYYYNVDRFSSSSHYMAKTIGQKAKALISDPYDPEFDEEIPKFYARADRSPQGELKDPVKGALSVLEELKGELPGLAFQDVELSGALLRLELVRQEPGSLYPVEMQSQLTNVSYLASFPENNPALPNLLLPPTAEDLNHLLFMAERSENEDVEALLAHSSVEKLESKTDLWRLPVHLLPEKTSFQAEAYMHQKEISHVMVPTTLSKKLETTVERRGDRLFYKIPGEAEMPLDPETPLFTMGKVELDVKERLDSLVFSVIGSLQKKTIRGETAIQGLQIAKAHFDTQFSSMPEVAPPWPFLTGGKTLLPKREKEVGVLIAKSFMDNGVRIGDCGYLGYSAPSPTGAQETHLPIYVAGFYDPGIMAVGNKCILVPSEVTTRINASNSAFTLDPAEANSIFVWTPNLKDANKVKGAILEKLQAAGIENYWKVETFREYGFAKDLMQQFESDKYLFSLIGVIILLVACTNIISLLVLLVSDKKKEIGILRAMGAKRRSIAAIFAFSGGSLGLFSCLLGLLLAFVTLKNIDGLVHFLSLIQGHDAFNAQFFGQSLPKTISPRALLFAAIATPVLSLVAGLFPAIKAARLSPCDALRSE